VCAAGVNNNAYQISRALYHNSRTGSNINDLSQFVKADFMNMPFEDNSFDAVYQIDATCHAPDQVGCYKVGVQAATAKATSPA
jgi:sterol 24-C-methyltransferase